MRTWRSVVSFMHNDTELLEMLEILICNSVLITYYPPVLPMPALQWTTMGGPPRCPLQSPPISLTAVAWQRLTSSRNSSMASAERGVPKSGQLVNWKCAILLLSPVWEMIMRNGNTELLYGSHFPFNSCKWPTRKKLFQMFCIFTDSIRTCNLHNYTVCRQHSTA